MSPGSSTDSYPAFARILLRGNPGKTSGRERHSHMMENFYTARVHGFPNLTARGLLTGVGSSEQMTQEGVLSLVVVLGSSVSLVGLVFAFITYRYELILKFYRSCSTHSEQFHSHFDFTAVILLRSEFERLQTTPKVILRRCINIFGYLASREMSPGSSAESYPAFAQVGLRENPGKNLYQVILRRFINI
ncbi:hypothetical protein ANN_04298 [Periplaneta americana]|uniref:Uncharacterized protein n=1 Tax=Periplaneta americana TaxID=6978 RepID=A0ABQ8T869_PERAM|nr:hypothetical protein ANN_04298 [Periplaneta americana]